MKTSSGMDFDRLVDRWTSGQVYRLTGGQEVKLHCQ